MIKNGKLWESASAVNETGGRWKPYSSSYSQVTDSLPFSTQKRRIGWRTYTRLSVPVRHLLLSLWLFNAPAGADGSEHLTCFIARESCGEVRKTFILYSSVELDPTTQCQVITPFSTDKRVWSVFFRVTFFWPRHGHFLCWLLDRFNYSTKNKRGEEQNDDDDDDDDGTCSSQQPERMVLLWRNDH